MKRTLKHNKIMLKAIINHESLKKNYQTLIMFKAIFNYQNMKKNDQTLQWARSLKKNDLLCTAIIVFLSLFTLHWWICVQTGNKSESEWCASCLISHCYRPPSAVGKGSAPARSRTEILDTWSRCRARVVRGNFKNWGRFALFCCCQEFCL